MSACDIVPNWSVERIAAKVVLRAPFKAIPNDIEALSGDRKTFFCGSDSEAFWNSASVNPLLDRMSAVSWLLRGRGRAVRSGGGGAVPSEHASIAQHAVARATRRIVLSLMRVQPIRRNGGTGTGVELCCQVSPPVTGNLVTYLRMNQIVPPSSR